MVEGRGVIAVAVLLGVAIAIVIVGVCLLVDASIAVVVSLVEDLRKPQPHIWVVGRTIAGSGRETIAVGVWTGSLKNAVTVVIDAVVRQLWPVGVHEVAPIVAVAVLLTEAIAIIIVGFGVLVDRAVAVVVDALGHLAGCGMPRGIRIVAVTAKFGPTVPIVIEGGGAVIDVTIAVIVDAVLNLDGWLTERRGRIAPCDRGPQMQADQKCSRQHHEGLGASSRGTGMGHSLQLWLTDAV